MCDLTAYVGFDDLMAVTYALVDVWELQPVTVRRLPVHLEYDRAGEAWPTSRVIRYARRAPLSTVPHELAHLVCPADDHGPMWQARMIAFASSLTC